MAELGCFASIPLQGQPPDQSHPFAEVPVSSAGCSCSDAQISRRACSQPCSLEQGDFPRGAHLFQDDALGVGGPGEGLLPLVSQMALLVVLVRPQLRPAVVAQLAPGSEPPRLSAHRPHPSRSPPTSFLPPAAIPALSTGPPNSPRGAAGPGRTPWRARGPRRLRRRRGKGARSGGPAAVQD